MEENQQRLKAVRLYACAISSGGKTNGHETAHRLLQTVLHLEYGIILPNLSYNSHGKPYLTDFPQIHFNLSHCDGLAVCAVGTASMGVDSEKIRPMRTRVLQRSFSPEEASAVLESENPDEIFFRYWTLKESYVKAIGIGVSYPLHTVCFTPKTDTICSNVSGWQFQQFLFDSDWVISCCIPDGLIPPSTVRFLTPEELR